MRTFVWLFLQVAVLSGQTLPSYLSSTYPAGNATGVPTNVNIVLQAQAQVFLPFAPGPTGYYNLRSSAGTTIPLNGASCFCSVVLIPAAPLAPDTVYTFTVNPGFAAEPAYSFSFTTGTGADAIPPQLLGANPPPGSANQGLYGPFSFQFSKPIVRSSGQGVTGTTTPKGVSANSSMSFSADGTTLIINIAVPQGYPTSYTFTIDPTKFLDADGNSGIGTPLTALYTTFVATDTSGPHLQTSLPLAGATGVPTNIMPRLIFQKDIDITTQLWAINYLTHFIM